MGRVHTDHTHIQTTQTQKHTKNIFKKPQDGKVELPDIRHIIAFYEVGSPHIPAWLSFLLTLHQCMLICMLNAPVERQSVPEKPIKRIGEESVST